jgi:hypothetical protein
MKNLVPEDRPSWTARLSELFSGPPKTKTATRASRPSKPDRKPDPGPGPDTTTDREDIIPPERRKAVMSTLDDTEHKFSLGALVLATVAGIAIPAYILATNKVTKHGKNSIAVAPDALLLGGAILLFCLIGFLALWKRKRTFLTFTFFLIGFGFTLFVGLVGFVFIFLGGWLLLRAWRINRYGTTNSKLIAREARNQPRGRDRKQAARTASTKGGAKTTTTSSAAERRSPTPSKRYTPKAPPRKKIPKPVAKPGE